MPIFDNIRHYVRVYRYRYRSLLYTKRIDPLLSGYDLAVLVLRHLLLLPLGLLLCTLAHVHLGVVLHIFVQHIIFSTLSKERKSKLFWPIQLVCDRN